MTLAEIRTLPVRRRRGEPSEAEALSRVAAVLEQEAHHLAERSEVRGHFLRVADRYAAEAAERR